MRKGWGHFLETAQSQAITPLEIKAAIALLRDGWPWRNVVTVIKRDEQSLANLVRRARDMAIPPIDEEAEAKKLREIRA